MSDQPPLRIGTRGSPLALWQADWVAARLESQGVHVERVLITTSGDRDQASSIAGLGTVGAFTKEVQRAVLDGRADIAVHSLKDLPTDATVGLTLAAVPSRGPVGDVLVTLDGISLDDLPPAARVGTGSLRRRAGLWRARPDLQLEGVRGNVDTRLKKLADGQYKGLVLAAAGLVRLQLAAGMTWTIPTEILLPAVGQGALGIEARVDDTRAREVLATIDDRATRAAVVAERTMLSALTAGCLAPVGAWGRIDATGQLILSATVHSRDGSRKLGAEANRSADECVALGEDVARLLLAQGAADLIRESRES